jgi:3-oxoacyl-[acyl-carrier-protein] synthase I
MKPVAITRYTLCSALGHGRAAQVSALLAGRSGLRQLRFEPAMEPYWLGEVAGLDAPLPSHLSAWECRNNRLAWLALQQDDFLSDAQRLREHIGEARVGVFMGTSTAGIHSAELAYRELGIGTVLPGWFDYRHAQAIQSVAAFVRAALGLCGPAQVISTACSSSAKVFAAACRALQAGYCDAAIVGGVDSLCLTTLYGFRSLQLLSTDICRPADAARSGIAIGEAGGFAILETANASANVPFLLGYGESGDAYHMSTPHPLGLGAAGAMRAALQRADLPAHSVSYINLHGTGTQANDAAEDAAVFAIFGDATPCSSTKGWTGHTLGAAGMVEAAISLLCIEHGLLPRSLGTRVVDPKLRSNVLMQSRRERLRTVLSNSFGFGGSNCSLLFGIPA